MPRFLEPVPLEAIDGHSVLLQTGFWGRFKARFGWTALAFLISGEIPLLALTRRIAGPFTLCYVPHGPLADSRLNQQEYYLIGVTTELRQHLKSGCVFVRYDLPWGREEGEPSTLPLAAPFRRAVMDIQPPNTVILDLRRSEDELLSAMKHKTRYNVHLAERKGVVVHEGGLGDLDAWYAMYRETAARDRITIHSLAYYRALFEPPRGANGSPWTRLLLATHEADLLAGIVVAMHGKRATYLFGASSNAKRNYMASYLVQWSAMKMLKAEGASSYDLFGISAEDNPADPMHGLYRFKTGFGGTILRRPGSWDYPLMPVTYAAYRAAEAARRYYYKDFKKRSAAAAGA